MFSKLFQYYNEYHVGEIHTNRFQPEVFHHVLDQFKSKCGIEVLGRSVEGRPIRMIRIGHGKTKVLMWTQMHGNESTASRAILDLLNLHANPGSVEQEWQNILESISLYIIPIVNPDGTARFSRRNALQVDLNRDARAFECPESVILRKVFEEINPDIGFNLHDQRRFYNIEGTAKPSTISFLAPAYDESENINSSRKKAMQLIASMRQNLESVIPGQVGLYDDSYAPRAFGDYAQSRGISTILVESGWQQYDMEKEFVRKLNFALLGSALWDIAGDTYSDIAVEQYKEIPMNDEKLFDVLIRGVLVVRQDKQYHIDIGISREEVSLLPGTSYYSKGIVTDLGDLQEWYGFEELEAGELMLAEGKLAEMDFNDWANLDEIDKINYIKQGFLFIEHQQANGETSNDLINYITSADNIKSALEFEGLANFILINRQGELKYIVLNGFLWPIDQAPPEGCNGLIMR